MGLTVCSTGSHAVDSGLNIDRGNHPRVFALAGNPNVGKSTLFNALTGMNQHTGNWPGKTVATMEGSYVYQSETYVLVDLPGTYSLSAHSAEEECARDFLCFEKPAGAVVVCDASCLERNLNLVLQTMEIVPKTMVCVNLLDEAKKKKIHVDLKKLEELLGVPVVGVTAREKEGLEEFQRRLSELYENEPPPMRLPEYDSSILKAAKALLPAVPQSSPVPAIFAARKLLEEDDSFLKRLNLSESGALSKEENQTCFSKAEQILLEASLPKEEIPDRIISAIYRRAEEISKAVVTCQNADCHSRDRRLDKILTHRVWGIPLMILLLGLTFWITISGANYPSELLSSALFWLGDRIADGLRLLSAPEWLVGAFADGVYRVLAWVVSVMLPPMAIFFPLFTLLEDSGYLPRIAFNLDRHFEKACACGKQALTMCMGFGCNAAGVVGCRIIDSPRERLIAILTNCFVPCNGRFPAMISLITMFFLGSAAGLWNSALSAILLTLVILLGIAMTFLMSRLLSKTILKGVPSSFTLELPPYRRPQIGKVIVRSIFDRTLFVLGRAAAVAAPAGLILWIFANVQIGEASLLSACAGFLDPFARLLGLDGVILFAFILGFPANEIVIPIIVMAYLAEGRLMELENLLALKELFVAHGWTSLTALCTILFSLFHWPCSTTCLTIYKETKSLKWTAAAILLPTLTGILLCAAVSCVGRIFL